jgi:uncharacterized phage-associated protein
MAHVQDVAAYILGKQGCMTAMKLQKLCYYSYGYHLAWEGRKLFPERFEAWANGPVAPALYRLHRGRFELQPGGIPGDPESLDGGERESVDLVLDAYGDFSAYQLSQLTHREPPWVNARRKAGAEPNERCGERLDDDDIAVHFEALVAAVPDEAGG